MFIGSTARAGSADTLDGMLWIAHWFWATIQNREAEFRNVSSVIHERHECSCQSFPDAFRRLNPEADETAACEFVLTCWVEVAHELGIDVSEDGRPT